MPKLCQVYRDRKKKHVLSGKQCRFEAKKTPLSFHLFSAKQGLTILTATFMPFLGCTEARGQSSSTWGESKRHGHGHCLDTSWRQQSQSTLRTRCWRTVPYRAGLQITVLLRSKFITSTRFVYGRMPRNYNTTCDLAWRKYVYIFDYQKNASLEHLPNDLKGFKVFPLQLWVKFSSRGII